MNKQASADGPIIEIQHLRKRFGSKLVLDDVNLSVDRGDILCIIGESGIGKSVILKHIIGLIIPDGGRILLDGEEISSPLKKSSDFLKPRKRLGMLFQGAALFDSMTVGENIAFPLREHTALSENEISEVVRNGLQMVGLENIEHQVSAELSGGMRSRVGLARAIAMKPEVMLYDEPTSALDPINSDKIDDLILDLRAKLGMTSIVVTHDIPSAYKIADRIAMIREGKIIFEGTPGEIRASRNPYVQRFIGGQRKHYYAVQDEKAYEGQVDLSRLRHKAHGPRSAPPWKPPR
ncbi:MAG: ATP-binding cassette domain-containing protein [Chitinivibrionales bacterium]|nr:ATP-binding cassette domain-containing protein [Chitinivibrionales bacterium]MBD3357422.1 ATP-binding cassette domain-containing protein [Chitinivibrionales bacterium]